MGRVGLWLILSWTMLLNSSAESASEVWGAGSHDLETRLLLACGATQGLGLWEVGSLSTLLGWNAPLTGRKGETAKVFQECQWPEMGSFSVAHRILNRAGIYHHG